MTYILVTLHADGSSNSKFFDSLDEVLQDIRDNINLAETNKLDPDLTYQVFPVARRY